jgi:mono/diheme cytochrome c family protein
LVLNEARYEADPAHSAQWNRGAYLVQGLGHCGACHTPRNLLGAERYSLAMTGGVYLDFIKDAVHDQELETFDNVVRPWAASNLTPSPGGLGAWSVDDITTYLKTGHNSRAGAFGPMSEVVANSTRHLTDEDLHAIAVYLKSLPRTAREIDTPVKAQQMEKGLNIFSVRCGDCHLPTGLGVPRAPEADPTKIAPPLVGSSVVLAADPATLINVILFGAHEAEGIAGEQSWPKMPGYELDFGLGMGDEEVAVLANYVRNSWGNRASAVEPKDVAKQRAPF